MSDHPCLAILDHFNQKIIKFQEQLNYTLKEKQQVLRKNIEILKLSKNGTSRIDTRHLEACAPALQLFSFDDIQSHIDHALQDIQQLKDLPTPNVTQQEVQYSEEVQPTREGDEKTNPSGGLQNTSQPSAPQSEAQEKAKEEVQKREAKPKKKEDPTRLSMDVYPPRSIEEVAEQLKNTLTRISMNNNKLGDSLCEAIAKINPSGLTYLSLQSNNITSAGFKLLGSCSFSDLQHLYFANNLLGELAVPFEFQLGNWRSLKHLSLTNNKISKAGMPNFAKYFPDLKSLSLKLNPIGDDGVHAFLGQSLPELECLHLESCQITSAIRFPEEDHPLLKRFPRLIKLYLNGNKINTEALRSLFNSGIIVPLELLNLEKNELTKADMELLLKDQWKLANLESLDLSENGLTIDSVREFSKISLRKLQYLYLKKNGFPTLEVLAMLRTCDMPKLRNIQIDGNNFESSNEYKVKRIMEELKAKERNVHIHV